MSYSYSNLGYLEAKYYQQGIKLDPLSTTEHFFNLVKNGIGIEDRHLDYEKQEWLLNYQNKSFTKKEQEQILQDLANAQFFEQNIAREFVGQKRFSLEGLDGLIPGLNALIHALKNDHVVIGMAHRGRLNVLCNVLGKPYSNIVKEFNGFKTEHLSDVKYHLGYVTKQKQIIELLPNPSHLESVYPVALGRAFATNGKAIVIHGDSAVSGQGVVYESLNLAKLDGFNVGGTIHVVLDNQVGFTTNKHSETRSTVYPSDIFKHIGAPVLHINADEPESVVAAFILAKDYNEQFNEDVAIHLVGYRRFGHNEADDPSLTQPKMYKTIKSHTRVYEQYAQKLNLQCEFKSIDKPLYEFKQIPLVHQQVTKELLVKLGAKLTKIPKDFTPSPIVKKLFNTYAKALENNENIPWGLAENLAYSLILASKIPIRITGQDSQRGTFSHRHGVIHDQNNYAEYNIFDQFGANQILNSSLSEAGVLGFEFGDSLALSKLNIWEAQFGDFANSAQVIIDQFIVSARAKWQQKSNLVLLLPHGYEGQGPEHSSARIERFLQLAAMDNMRVCQPTSSASMFHLLLSQLKQDKPLVVFTPKSLLRAKAAMSEFKDLYEGKFEPIIRSSSNNNKIMILCSGKIYHQIKELNLTFATIVCMEQLYPLPDLSFIKKNYHQVFWCQEEPENQGAWQYIKTALPFDIKYIGREAFSAPAEGQYINHTQNQQKIIQTLKDLHSWK